MLLAYYIAAINIEASYHSLVGGKYVPFEGICLTDTFQMYEKEDLVNSLTVDNSARRTRQKRLDIRVIVGNPPYSAGQTSANDNNANIDYPHLDERIRSTYVAGSLMTSVRQLYDSYIRAIRWASDRIGNAGIIGFVTNAGWVESNQADGLRKCLADEFSNIYVFHLRGNQRTSGETSRKEGGKIFGSGSRAPIAVSLLVKNPNAAQHGRIYFHDIGDYLTREEKLEKIEEFSSVAGIIDWKLIIPDDHGDWLKQRDNSFSDFIVLGDKKGNSLKLFDNFSLGVGTNRDAWCYNFSRTAVASNMANTIAFYNAEVTRFKAEFGGCTRKIREEKAGSFINNDPTKISWSSSLIPKLISFEPGRFDANKIIRSLYRPFTKQWLYFDGMFNHRISQMKNIFPDADSDNLLIIVKQNPAETGHFAFMLNCPPELQTDGGSQCFPLYLYDEEAPAQTSDTQDMFVPAPGPTRRNRRDAITDAGLVHFEEVYPGETITKKDLFYYVYGLLHSPDYRTRYADNLSKELPRIPRVKTAADFWAFSYAGRALADLHLAYETVQPYPLTIETRGTLTDADYRVEKMKFAKKGDKTTVIYNRKITLRGIPESAWNYEVNGKAALDWVMERQCVKADKDSAIVNDANDWAIETMANPKYPLELFQRVVTVSLETQRIVSALPRLDI